MGLEMLPLPVVDRASDEPVHMPTDHTEADVRVLTEEEVEQVRPVFAEYGHSLPNPATSCFVGAVEEGKVVGFLCLQLRLHAEPMWIADGSSALFSRIAHEAEKVIQQRVGTTDVYLFAPAGKIARLAQAMGMQVEPWVVMSKLVVAAPVVHQEEDEELPDLDYSREDAILEQEERDELRVEPGSQECD